MLTEKDLERSNAFLAEFLPKHKPFTLDSEDPGQVLKSESLEFQIYHGPDIQDKFGLQVWVCYPGVRYRRDGSGEPDDWDLKDLSDHDSLAFALNELVIHVLKEKLSNWWENRMLDEYSQKCEEREV